MTKMLVSVTTAEDARSAVEAGADILDFDLAGLPAGEALAKNYAQRLSADAEGKELWASIGVWSDDEALLRNRTKAAGLAGVGTIRIAAPAANHDRALAWKALAQVPLPVMATLFADRGADPDLLHPLFDVGFSGVILDTSDQSRLLDHLPPARLAEFVMRCRALGLSIGFSGSAEAPDIPRLLHLAPDMIGFHVAPVGGRKSINLGALRHLRSMIPAGPIDMRGRREESRHPPMLDKIFVSDFVLPVEIGAYKHEHGQTQKVRFDVTAFIGRRIGMPRDMRDIVSYDLILDGIKTIVATGHVTLAETLAEEVAAMVLRHPRVERVLVKVQKLELGPGGVGVEIERERAGTSA